MKQTLDLPAFVHAAADAIIAAGADGRIIFWNPAATRIFGFTETEALGQSLDLIIPERFRARHWEGYRLVMEWRRNTLRQRRNSLASWLNGALASFTAAGMSV